jgi:hypothetical protein
MARSSVVKRVQNVTRPYTGIPHGNKHASAYRGIRRHHAQVVKQYRKGRSPAAGERGLKSLVALKKGSTLPMWMV